MNNGAQNTILDKNSSLPYKRREITTFCSYVGQYCEVCEEGYYRDTSGGSDGVCVKCECSGNIDPSAIGNCDGYTGECLRCIYNTAGYNCERCKKGYWGAVCLREKEVSKKHQATLCASRTPNVTNVNATRLAL